MPSVTPVPITRTPVPHNITVSATTTKAAAHTIPPGLPIFAPLQHIDIGALLPLGIAVVIMMVLVIVMKMRAATKPDLYAFTVDDTEGSIYLMPCIKIGDRIYAAISTKHPLFVIVPKEDRIYKCYVGKGRTVPCVMVYSRGFLSLPVDPKVNAALSFLMDSSDDLMSFEQEDIVKALRALYDMEEKRLGRIRVTAPAVIGIAFNVRKLIREIINKTFDRASEAIAHYFAFARNIENLEKYLKMLATYAEKRYAWILYIALGVMIAAIALALVGTVFK